MSARLNCIALVIGVCFASSANASSFAVIGQPKTSPSIITLGVPAKPSTPPVSSVAADASGGFDLPPLTYASQAPPELVRKPSFPSGTVVSASIVAFGEPGVEDMKVAAVPKSTQHDTTPFVMRGGIWGDTGVAPVEVPQTTVNHDGDADRTKTENDGTSQASTSNPQDASSSPEPQRRAPVSGAPPGGLVPIR